MSNSTMPRILVSNDDGIQALGIQTLAEHLTQIGEVWVVAPDRERSATSHSISLHKPLRLRRVAERRYCVDGTPTDSVYLALHHVMDAPPDVVVSGINHGSNLGNDVMYSGTVSAAMEGALFGYRAVAASLCLEGGGEDAPQHFEAAAQVLVHLVRGVLAKPMPPGVLLNVNVPNRPRTEMGGIKLTRLGYTAWEDRITARHDPRGRPYYWIGGERGAPDMTPDSDSMAVRAGQVSVTPVHFDVTDQRSFGYVRSLDLTGMKALPDGLGDQPLAALRFEPRRRVK